MKIKDYLFTGTHKEEEIELSPESYLNLDPEYIRWSENYEKRANERSIQSLESSASGDDRSQEGLGEPVCKPVF